MTQLTSRDSGTDPSGQGPKTTDPASKVALAKVSKRGNLPPGVTIEKVNKSMFKSASNAKGGSPCAPEAAKADSGPVWEGGKTYKETPIEEDGQYNPPGWSAKGEEDDDKKKKKDVKKSITELRYGSQLARNHDVGKSCGMCGRISKSCGDHKGGGCCDDCKKSMSVTQWHKSHLS